MTTDEWDAQQRECVFCLAKRSPVDGTVYRNCELCVGRSGDRWCEHDCDWLTSHPIPEGAP